MIAYLGEIRMFSGNNYVPEGWALCDGKSILVRDNEALFSLIGVQYGGNGTTDFKLPNLCGRVPVNTGQTPGMSNYPFAREGGAEQVQLVPANLPSHTHVLNATNTPANQDRPEGNILAAPIDPEGKNTYVAYLNQNAAGVTKAQLDTKTLESAGGNEPHDNLMPYMTLNYIICLKGEYPSFND